MIGKKILNNEGVTHDVFKEPEKLTTEEAAAPLETVGSEVTL